MIPMLSQFDLLYSDYQQLDTPERFGQFIFNRTGFEIENSYNETDTQAAWCMLRRAVINNQCTSTSDWIKFDIYNEATYPPANSSRLIRFKDGTCGVAYITDNNDNNHLGSGVGKKWAFYSDAGFANLENVTHHHPLPTPPNE